MKSTAKLQVVPEKQTWDENLRLWLVGYLKETSMSTTEFARAAGGSRTLWDDYVKCTYFGVPDPKNGNKIRSTENSKVEPMLRAYRARVEGPNAENRSEFAKTTAAVQLWAALRTAVEENAITLAHGNFGVGKTRCMNEFLYKKLKTPAVHIVCSPNATTRHFLKKVAKQLGFKSPSCTIPDLEDLIIGYLKSHPRLLAIDQSNYLPLKALGSVAYIWEMTRAPVTLVGTNTLIENFFDPRLTSDERGQLASRVAMIYPLAGLDLGTVKGICHRVLGRDVATDALVKTIWEKAGGKFTDDGDALTANFRSLEFRLRRLVKLVKVNPTLPIDKVMELVDRMLLVA